MSSPASLEPADVFRTVAHELGQPLSSIESIAYYLSLVLPRADAKSQEHLARIQELVEQSNWILSNGLCVADPIEPGPSAARPGLRMDLAGILLQAR